MLFKISNNDSAFPSSAEVSRGEEKRDREVQGVVPGDCSSLPGYTSSLHLNGVGSVPDAKEIE